MRRRHCFLASTGRAKLTTAGVIFALGVAGATLLAQESNTRTMKIPDGTPVPLYLKDDLSSKKNKPNDPIRFQVRENVRVDGVVVIPFGTWVAGHILAVGEAGFVGHAGKLNFSVDSLPAADGTKILLRGAPTVKGGSNTAVAAAAAAAYGPAALFMRGSHAEIRKGTMLTAYVDGEKEVTVTLLRLPGFVPKPPAEVPAPAPAADSRPPNPLDPGGAEKPDEHATLTVKSDPEGAEILVNGKFAGSTPSELRLEPGDYTIGVRKAGFIVWQRTITLRSAANVTLDAPLMAGTKGLRLEQITDLLTANVSQTRIAQLVSERGVTFPWSSDAETKLRAAGAEDPLLQFIRNSAEPLAAKP